MISPALQYNLPCARRCFHSSLPYVTVNPSKILNPSPDQACRKTVNQGLIRVRSSAEHTVVSPPRKDRMQVRRRLGFTSAAWMVAAPAARRQLRSAGLTHANVASLASEGADSEHGLASCQSLDTAEKQRKRGTLDPPHRRWCGQRPSHGGCSGRAASHRRCCGRSSTPAGCTCSRRRWR